MCQWVWCASVFVVSASWPFHCVCYASECASVFGVPVSVFVVSVSWQFYCLMCQWVCQCVCFIVFDVPVSMPVCLFYCVRWASETLLCRSCPNKIFLKTKGKKKTSKMHVQVTKACWRVEQCELIQSAPWPHSEDRFPARTSKEEGRRKPVQGVCSRTCFHLTPTGCWAMLKEIPGKATSWAYDDVLVGQHGLAVT